MEIKLTILGSGTSGGVPMIGCDCEVCTSADPRDNRLRTSAMVEIFEGEGEVTRLIIDPGPDLRQQMLRHQVRRISAVLITHQHRDHTGGMDDLRAYYYMQGAPLPVYCQRDVARALRREYRYAFSRRVRRRAAVPRFDLRKIKPRRGFEVGGHAIEPIRVWHDRLKIVGYKIANRLVYITDANHIPEKSMEQIKGCKTLVINALRHTPHHSHFTLDQALEIIRKINPQQAIITHISHQMGLYAQQQKKIPKNTTLAFDNLEIFC